jgi:hypothetical protein
VVGPCETEAVEDDYGFTVLAQVVGTIEDCFGADQVGPVSFEDALDAIGGYVGYVVPRKEECEWRVSRGIE